LQYLPSRSFTERNH